MPNDKFSVVGGYGYSPSPEQTARVQTFLRWLPAKAKPASVIILRPEDFGKAAKMFSQVPTNVGFSVGDRSYINAALFDPKNTILQDELRGKARVGASDAPEWVLAHEALHLGSHQDPQLQEMHDNLYNDDANAIIGQWNSKPVRAYRALQSNAAKVVGQVQPTDVPPETQLTPPMSPQVQKIMNQQPVRSHAERVMAQQPSSSISMADRMKLQPEE